MWNRRILRLLLPTIAFTAVSVSRMPTEKASRLLRGTASSTTSRSSSPSPSQLLTPSSSTTEITSIDGWVSKLSVTGVRSPEALSGGPIAQLPAPRTAKASAIACRL